MVFLAEVADRPKLVAWSNPMLRKHSLEKIQTQKGSCSRFSASLLVPATCSPFCAKTRSTGEPRTVPSLAPLRREERELNKDFG
jgi:hypothetical protein